MKLEKNYKDEFYMKVMAEFGETFDMYRKVY